MKQHLLIIIAITIAACNNKQSSKIEREGKPTIYGVKDDDKEMNEAIKTANQTLDKFKKALIQGENQNLENFSIKMRFDTEEGGEHIWLSNITLKDNKYFGEVGNEPQSTTEVKLGDTVEIDNNRISDWMYIEDGKLIGGYTIKLLRKRMTAAERKQFDEENGLIIED